MLPLSYYAYFDAVAVVIGEAALFEDFIIIITKEFFIIDMFLLGWVDGYAVRR